MDIATLTLEQYIAAPLGVQFSYDKFSQQAIKLFASMTGNLCRIYPVRVHTIKKLIKRLVADNMFSPFAFKVSRKFKPEACMHEKGVIYFSYGIFLKSSRAGLMSVLCHELAHIWLSQQPWYSHLKEVNRQFKAAYREKCGGEQTTAMSPVELYATLISADYLRTIVQGVKNKKQQKETYTRIDAISAKINLLNNQINCLQTQNFVV